MLNSPVMNTPEKLDFLVFLAPAPGLVYRKKLAGAKYKYTRESKTPNVFIA